MAVKTANKFGRIYVTDMALAMIVNHVAAECYGVLGLVSQKLSDNILSLFNRPVYGEGVKITIVDNKINVDIFVILKEGVSISAITESLISAVKYVLETYTGMRVKSVVINVVGIRA